jgi:hypothetical protein
VREDQREQIAQFMAQQKAKIGDPKEFALSLSDRQGHWHDLKASIDYYDFMGKPLSILRLVGM